MAKENVTKIMTKLFKDGVARPFTFEADEEVPFFVDTEMAGPNGVAIPRAVQWRPPPGREGGGGTARL